MFTSELEKINREELLISSNTNENFNVFHDKIHKYDNKYFPIKTKYISTKRLHNAWLTTGILNSIKHKSNLFKMYRLGIISHDIFKQFRNKLTQVIRTAKTNHYPQIFTNFRHNTKKIWQTINELKGNTYKTAAIKTLQYI